MDPLYLEDTKLRILWISDMHLHKGYATHEELNSKFVRAFVDFYEESENFDYILFSGDIAFSAHKDEYELFWEMFIKKIHAIHEADQDRPFPVILSIPGNHDISWAESEIFEGFLSSFTAIENRDRNSFLKQHKAAFFKCFESYSKSFSGTGPSAWKRAFDLPEHSKVCDNYRANRLFGYLIDHAKKCLFVFVNTSWFSMGGQFDELLLRRTIKKIGEKPTSDFSLTTLEQELRSMLATKAQISEYGNQIIGRELLKTDSGIGDQLELAQKYAVLTIMHHPLDWLSWFELYDYDPETQDRFMLTKILGKTDILLTSHEHAPVNTPSVKVGGGYTHLKSGMFLDDNLEKPQEEKIFQQSCMSVVEHSTRGNLHTVYREQFLYKRGREEDNGEWMSVGGKERLYQSVKFAICTAQRKNEICQILKSRDAWELVGKLMPMLVPESAEQVYIDEYCRAIRLETEKLTTFLILPFVGNCLSKLFPSNSLELTPLDNILQGFVAIPGKTVRVHYLWFSLLIDEGLTNKYHGLAGQDRNADEPLELSCDRLTKQMADRADFHFGLFQHACRERWEEHSGQPDALEWPWNLNFINEIVPSIFLEDILQVL